MDHTPFHPGELEAQALAGVASRGAGIRETMPDQHRIFFGQLPLLFAAVPDETGHPLATVLSGAPGFIRSPRPTTLSVRALPDADDPAAAHLRPAKPIGLLGLEFQTRRRNRANGLVTARDGEGFSVAVMQSFGNCPKYIQARTPVAVARSAGRPVEALAGLDEAARALLARSDTVFIASTSAERRHGGLDISHRGGRPGFVGVAGDVLTLPDFIGNNYFNTLGNLLRDPRASLLVVDFDDGTVLQLQGRVEVVWSGDERERLDGAERIWRFHVERGWRRTGALPLRWSAPEPAPTTLATGVWAAA